MPLVMGTAGHIDHGKTALVKALTGVDCDRLEEEKRRGITIELGFAHLDLPGGERLGIVDVPGHEKFVRNMVAGAAGIDFVLLIVAADEGVMPQTREHMEICSLLGISQGLVALTKTDLVDQDFLELAQEDVREYLEGTFLQGAPIFPVSARTGQGMTELIAGLTATTVAYKPARRTDLTRLPVDRIFTMRGHGTVVTGTLVSGEIQLRREVVLYPGERKSKVRGLQSHGENVETAPAGRRTAVNLQGIDVADVSRGEVLAYPDTLFPTLEWDVELTCLPSSPRALRHRTEIHFHHGSGESLARLYFFGRDRLPPGETAPCRIRFKEPMVGVFGDKVVVRAYSPLRTVAGGTLINPLAPKIGRASDYSERLAMLASDDEQLRIETQLILAGQSGLTFSRLLVLTNLASKALEKMLQSMGANGRIHLFDRDGRGYVAQATVEELQTKGRDFLQEFHRKEPLQQGVPRGVLTQSLAQSPARRLPDKLTHFLVERMVKQGLVVVDQDLFHLPGHKVSLASDQAGLREQLLEAHTKAGLTPPNLKELLASLNLSLKEAEPVLRRLREEGTLVRVEQDMYFFVEALTALKEQIVEFFKSSEEMAPADFKEITGLSRKYVIPLLEFLDREKVTVRVGDVRQLRAR
jgi:selenocysteine-specific elongation factor